MSYAQVLLNQLLNQIHIQSCASHATLGHLTTRHACVHLTYALCWDKENHIFMALHLLAVKSRYGTCCQDKQSDTTPFSLDFRKEPVAAVNANRANNNY